MHAPKCRPTTDTVACANTALRTLYPIAIEEVMLCFDCRQRKRAAGGGSSAGDRLQGNSNFSLRRLGTYHAGYTCKPLFTVGVLAIRQGLIIIRSCGLLSLAALYIHRKIHGVQQSRRDARLLFRQQISCLHRNIAPMYDICIIPPRQIGMSSPRYTTASSSLKNHNAKTILLLDVCTAKAPRLSPPVHPR